MENSFTPCLPPLREARECARVERERERVSVRERERVRVYPHAQRMWMKHDPHAMSESISPEEEEEEVEKNSACVGLLLTRGSAFLISDTWFLFLFKVFFSVHFSVAASAELEPKCPLISLEWVESPFWWKNGFRFYAALKMILGHGPLLYNWIQLICSWYLLVCCCFKEKALGDVALWAEFIFCAMSVWHQGFEWFQLSSLENQNLSWISRLKASQWNKFVVVVASVKICWKTILSNSQFFYSSLFFPL